MSSIGGAATILGALDRRVHGNVLMLVVTSNWCVPDGTLSAGPTRATFDRLRAEVRRASLRAGFRPDGRYRPVADIAVVFAGDTFDWLTSREWTGAVRPWERSRRASAARERVAAGSLRTGGRLVATLAAWGRRGLTVPDDDRRGRPSTGSFRRIPMRICLLRGDRDRWIDRLFAQAPVPALSVGTRWMDGMVTVRHGEEIEPLWHASGPEPTAGESLAVELITRFALTIDASSGNHPARAGIVRRIVVGRLADAPARLAHWLETEERSGTLSTRERSTIVDAWNRAVHCWHRAARQLGLGRMAGVDLADGIAASFTIPGRAGEGLRPHATAADSIVRGEQSSSESSGDCEILGHPPAGFVPPASWCSRVMCIGPAAIRACGLAAAAADRHETSGLALVEPRGMIPRVAVTAAAATPAVAVVARGPTGPWLDWLTVAGGAVFVDGRGDEADGRCIWRSPVIATAHRVVDAA